MAINHGEVDYESESYNACLMSGRLFEQRYTLN